MATHATRVVSLGPRIDRRAEQERLAADLNQAIVTRHDHLHHKPLDDCDDIVCGAFVALRTAVA